MRRRQAASGAIASELDVVHAIAAVPTQADWPIDDVVIESVARR